ncbi:MAG TPA: tail fiber protein [Solirubrobacteraceae bacterium]|jgi:microcystin-dependent protein|nr:tail fiber protein [Solirubrobacteraceae bacterium]
MAEPFLGEIRTFGFNFAPQGWAMCAGQLLAISQNSALFALIGTFYGGDGVTTFALPDLRGRVGINMGQGPGLSPYQLGEVSGSENVTLTTGQMPSHAHALNANAQQYTTTRPAGHVPAQGGTYAAVADGTTMNAAAIGPAGGNQPHTNIQPFLGLNFCIALEGIFPSRN